VFTDAPPPGCPFGSDLAVTPYWTLPQRSPKVLGLGTKMF
jgi:hypothetical protein